MNRRERRAARARGGGWGGGADDMPPGYIRQIERMGELIKGWLRANPGARPIFRMPPREAWVVVELGAMADRVAGNDAARAMLTLLLESFPPEKEPSLFMLRVALAGYPLVELVPLEVFTAGYELMPMQRGGKA